MAITRAQQAKQMLQDGGMLVKPGFGGKRQGYKEGDRESYGAEGQYADSGGRSDRGGGRRPDKVSKPPAPPAYDEFGPQSKRNFGFMNEARRRVNPLGRLTEVPGTIGFISRAITPNPFGFGPPDIGFNDPTRDGKGDIPLWMQLGYNSEAEYNAAMAGGAATSAAESDPPVNLNRMAYRLMAEGGVAMDDEPRQAYGLGSIVKKATRAIKKVAKSDIGKLALIAGLSFGIPGTQIGGLFGRASFGGAAKGLFGQYGLGATLGAGKAKFFSDPMTRAFGKDALMGDPAQFFTGKAAEGLGMSLGKKAALGIAGISALPLLGIGVEDEEEQTETSPYLGEGLDIAAIRANPRRFQGQAYRLMAEGGDTEDAKEPVAKKVMPLIDMDGKEKDYRETGGFVDMGRMEKADDVPARLSKNEFVFTADAVRNAGDGSVDKGAEVMYNMMKNLEAGGEVSEESQGLEGARKMFKTSQRLEEVL